MAFTLGLGYAPYQPKPKSDFMDPVSFDTPAGKIEVYQDREGYWVRNAEGYRIGDLGGCAFKTDTRAMSVALAICARLRTEA